MQKDFGTGISMFQKHWRLIQDDRRSVVKYGIYTGIYAFMGPLKPPQCMYTTMPYMECGFLLNRQRFSSTALHQNHGSQNVPIQENH